MLIAALFTIAKVWDKLNAHQQIKIDKNLLYKNTSYLYKSLSIYQWIKMRWYGHTHTHTHTMEPHSAITEKKVFPLAAKQMALEDIMLSDISQTEKYK